MKRLLATTAAFVAAGILCTNVFAYQDFMYDMRNIDDYIKNTDKVTRVEGDLLPVDYVDEDGSGSDVAAQRCIPYEKLVTEGIASDMTFDNSVITRGEFITMAMRMINAAKVEGNRQVFLDVLSERSDAGYINAAYDLRIISGSDGLYEPDAPITYADAISVAVRILGREDEAKANGGYPSGYLKTANRYKLLSGVNISDYSEAGSQTELYTLLQNTAESNGFAALEGFKNNEQIYRTDKTENILSYYLDIYSHEGIVEAVGISNIYSDSSNNAGKAVIGGKSFDADYDEYIEYLGMSAEVLYKKSDSGDKLLYIDYINRNKGVRILPEDNPKYSDGKYTYQSGDRNKTVALESGASVIYNGRIVTGDNAKIYTPKSGSVTLIDNNKNGAYDVIIIKSTEDIVIGDIDTDNMLIYDYNNNGTVGGVFDFDGGFPDREISLVDTAGKTVYFAMIKRGDILTVGESLDGKVIYGVISNSSEDGVITKVERDGGDTTVIINDKRYKVTSECETRCAALIAAGKSVRAKLNMYGEIADAEDYKAEASGLLYAYVIGTSMGNDAFASLNKLKILNASGEIKILDISERCNIDGTSYKDEKKQKSAIERGLNVGKVIMYRENENGEISAVDTAYTDTAEEDADNTLRKIYGSDEEKLRYKLWSFGGTFGEKFFWDKTRTTVFVIHTSETEDKKRYRVETVNYPFYNDNSYAPEAYRSTDSFYADVLVTEVGGGNDGVSSKELWAVEDIITTYIDDEVKTGIVINSGKEKKTVTMDTDTFKRFDVACGDIVRCDLTGDELIGNSLIKVYDCDDDEITEAMTTEYAEYNVRKCFIYDKKDNLLSLYLSDSADDMQNPVQGNVRIARPTSDVYVISKNSRGKTEVRKANQLDMRTYLSSSSNCTKLLVHYQYQLFQKIFILDYVK